MRIASCLILLFTSAATGLRGQDPDRLKFDTEQVRVLEVTSPPHVKGAMHQHRVNRVMIYLTEGRQTLTYEDGKVERMSWKAGEAKWSPAGGRHTSENTGDKPFQVVEVELKSKPAGFASRVPALDPVKVDPRHYQTEFENDQVRVLRVRYGPLERGPMHEHVLQRVVVYLTGQTMKVTTPDGKTEEVHNQAGDVKMAGAAKHQEENLDRQLFEVVVVELKP